MTSATSDVVTVSASSVASSEFEAYMTFDGDDQTYWSSKQNLTSGQYIQCRFENPVNVKKAYLSRNYISAGTVVWKLQASNDGNVWKDLTSDKTISVDYGKTLTVNFENDELYTYYRLYCVSSTNSWANLTTLQLYGKYA